MPQLAPARTAQVHMPCLTGTFVRYHTDGRGTLGDRSGGVMTACSSAGPCTSRSGKCPTKSSETTSAATGRPAHNSLIHLSYNAFWVLIADDCPSKTSTMRFPVDDDRPAQNVQFDQLSEARYRPADPNVRLATPARAPVITWLTRHTTPKSATRSRPPTHHGNADWDVGQLIWWITTPTVERRH